MFTIYSVLKIFDNNTQESWFFFSAGNTSLPRSWAAAARLPFTHVEAQTAQLRTGILRLQGPKTCAQASFKKLSLFGRLGLFLFFFVCSFDTAPSLPGSLDHSSGPLREGSPKARRAAVVWLPTDRRPRESSDFSLLIAKSRNKQSIALSCFSRITAPQRKPVRPGEEAGQVPPWLEAPLRSAK